MLFEIVKNVRASKLLRRRQRAVARSEDSPPRRRGTEIANGFAARAHQTRQGCLRAKRATESPSKCAQASVTDSVSLRLCASVVQLSFPTFAPQRKDVRGRNSPWRPLIMSMAARRDVRERPAAVAPDARRTRPHFSKALLTALLPGIWSRVIVVATVDGYRHRGSDVSACAPIQSCGSDGGAMCSFFSRAATQACTPRPKVGKSGEAGSVSSTHWSKKV